MIYFSKIRDVKTPSRGTELSAGIDFFIPNDYWTVTLEPNTNHLFPSGIKVDIPKDKVLIAFNKGSIAGKRNVVVGSAIIDADFQGEIFIDLHNIGTEPVTFEPGDKIIQFLLMPINYSVMKEKPIEDLYSETTKRGEGMLGSTNLIERD